MGGTPPWSELASGRHAYPVRLIVVPSAPGRPERSEGSVHPVAGDPVAGDPVAGDPVAGDPVAGDPVAGERILHLLQDDGAPP